ncbi:MAG: hypothetical protein KDA41_06620 [Planctomycetales bacterium]|nr:hypothetical protein [Planctomycetales bacterium]
MPLLADNMECIGNFAGLAVFLLFGLGGWALQQLGEAGKRREQKRRAQAARKPRPAAEVSSQMSDFVRQASQRPAATRPPATPPPGPPGQRRPRGLGTLSDPLVIEAEVLDDDAPVTTLRPSVASHVSTKDLSQHATALADNLRQADERMDAQLHQHLDHRVGSLGDSSDAVYEDPNADALPPEAVTTSETAAIFKNPERIREAIILQEILARPDDRW